MQTSPLTLLWSVCRPWLGQSLLPLRLPATTVLRSHPSTCRAPSRHWMFTTWRRSKLSPNCRPDLQHLTTSCPRNRRPFANSSHQSWLTSFVVHRRPEQVVCLNSFVSDDVTWFLNIFYNHTLCSPYAGINAIVSTFLPFISIPSRSYILSPPFLLLPLPSP